MFDYLDLRQFQIPQNTIQPSRYIFEEKIKFFLFLSKAKKFDKMFQGEILERSYLLYHEGVWFAGEIEGELDLDYGFEVIIVFDERVRIVAVHGESDNFGFH
jgi:hypothetical protein